jgi:hypothetical protein
MTAAPDRHNCADLGPVDQVAIVDLKLLQAGKSRDMLTPSQVITKLEANELTFLPRMPRSTHQSTPAAGIAGSDETGWIGVVVEDGKHKSVSEWTNSRPEGAEADLERALSRRA